MWVYGETHQLIGHEKEEKGDAGCICLVTPFLSVAAIPAAIEILYVAQH